MAEWLMRGTVNTFFRGSIPLDTLNMGTWSSLVYGTRLENENFKSREFESHSARH